MVYVEADKTAKEEFVLPVSWEVYSKIKVQANSLEEAINYAKEHIDEIDLDEYDNSYVDGSYKINVDSVEEAEIYQKKHPLCKGGAVS